MIGSSPLAVEAMTAARLEHKIDRTITTNRGIVLESQPTYYFLSDAQACQLWNAHARKAHLAGTTCVTLRRSDHALEKRGVEWFDIIQDEKPPYEPFVLSGLWCLEFAAQAGATTVLLAGMDGWSSSPDVMDYFDGSLGKIKHNTDWSRDVIAPRCRLLADKYPSVAWIQYGRPEFEVEAANWTVVRL